MTILFLNADGSVKRQLDHDTDTINSVLGISVSAASSLFGYDIDVIGDVNGDGVQDIAVGAPGDESVTIIFLERDGGLRG